MAANYWAPTLQRRISRRRGLMAAGAATAAGMLVAACGGDDNNDGGGASDGSGGGSGLLTKPVDQTSQPQKGGTLIAATSTRFTTWDPMAIPAIPFKRDYNELFYLKPGKLEPGKGEIGGDLVDSWELSPDKLSLTAKLTNQAHFSPVAPVNGREVDSSDVTFSWQRVSAQGLYRNELVNSINPAAPILSVTATDNKTIQMKFTEPLAGVLYLFASQGAMNMPIVPKEASDQNALDLRSQVAGTGMWNRAEVQEDVRFIWKRNAGFGQDERSGITYLDQEDWVVIPEYAAGLAQFKTGAVHVFAVQAEDVVATKRDVPALEMMATKLTTAPRYVIVGYGADSPFLDERIRRAYSMSWDRDLFIDSTYNVSKFEAEGLPMETRWSSALQAEAWDGWWLDPQSKDFGDNAKNYQHNIEEAKKLLSAAGHTDGLEFASAVPLDSPYGPTYVRDIDIVTGMTQEAGFKANQSAPQFATEFRQKYSQGKGDFSGLSYVNLFSAGIDPAAWFFRYFNSKGSFFYGFDADGSAGHKGDPQLDDLTKRMRLEFDEKKRMQLGYDIQRQVAAKMYFIAFPGGANGFDLAWPAVRNRMVYVDDVARPVGVTTTTNGGVWLDKTKAPFASA